MKLMSLFDGSGGFPLAGAMCGIEPVYASEVEPYPIAVTTSRFPRMKHLGDVSKVHGYDLDPVDIITFGSPCQDMSIAGKRAGIKHEAAGDEETTRSGLFYEAIRIIKEMREKTDGRYPTFAVWENVTGAFSSNKGEDFRLVLEEFCKICEPTAVMPAVPKGGWPYADLYCGDGWSLAYRTYDAQYWGVPQRRRRIYLVADFRGQRAGEIQFEREGVRGYFTQSGAQGQAASADAQGRIGADDRAFTLKIRSGCEGGGKGALIQEEKSATLSTLNDQYLFQPIAYSFDSLASNSMKSKNPHSGCRAVEIAKTLDTTNPDPSKNQGGIAIVQCYDARGNGDGETVPTLTGDHENRITDYTALTCYAQEAYDKYLESEQAVTLRASGGDYGGGSECLVAEKSKIRYIVRRLTPTECARLQGFPDLWGHPNHYDEFSDEQYAFWLEVRKTFDGINGRAEKQYTKEQMLKWYNGLHTDSSEYKMWGNGLALPNALYVMQGIMEVANGEQ